MWKNTAAADQDSSKVKVISNIESGMVPERARVVFDWDNTLKVINRKERKIECRVNASLLSHLVEEKHCELFIISAIRPSRMNLDTLLLEVDRLGLRQYFCPKENSEKRSPAAGANFPWMHEGNIIICGYDKAEAFLTFIKEDQIDFVDGATTDFVDGATTDFVDGATTDFVDGATTTDERPIVFFDDEDVNIENFSAIVKGSLCYKVV